MDTWILNAKSRPTIHVDVGRSSDSGPDTRMHASHAAMTIGWNLCFITKTTLRRHIVTPLIDIDRLTLDRIAATCL